MKTVTTLAALVLALSTFALTGCAADAPEEELAESGEQALPQNQGGCSNATIRAGQAACGGPIHSCTSNTAQQAVVVCVGGGCYDNIDGSWGKCRAKATSSGGTPASQSEPGPRRVVQH